MQGQWPGGIRLLNYVRIYSGMERMRLAKRNGTFAEERRGKKFSEAHAPRNAIDESLRQAEIAEMILNTRSLVRRRIVKQVKFNLELSEELLKVNEWTVERSMVDPHRSVTRITNGLSFNGNEEAFETSDLAERAKSMEIPDYEMVCGCAIKRADNPEQSVLVLATPTHLDMYSLNGSGEIESSRAELGGLEIGKKARVVVANAEQSTPFGKGIYLGVVDENVYEGISSEIRNALPRTRGGSAKTARKPRKAKHGAGRKEKRGPRMKNRGGSVKKSPAKSRKKK